ncbi:MAG: hypothetical protein WCT07_03895 [Candidatus Paceibacterota bacterium]|jgi:hypothetical protein
MTVPLIDPRTITIPWAANAGPSYITSVPDASQISITPGAASFTDGFPPVNMSDPLIDGIPPNGQDFNGVLNIITGHLQYMNAGGQYKFDAAISTALGGYPKGMVLQDNAGLNAYINILAGNTTDFNVTPSSIGVSWLPWAGAAVAPVTGGAINFAAPITLPSSATVAIGAAASNNIIISGSTPVSAFDTLAAGAHRHVWYSGAVPLTYNVTSMQLVGGVDRTNAVGDYSLFVSLGSGNWKELDYQPQQGYITPASLATTLLGYATLAGDNVFTGTNQFAAVRENYIAIPASNIDLALGNYYSKTIVGNDTLTVSNVPAAGIGQTIMLRITNGGAFTLNLWSGIKWTSGTPPTLTVSGRDDLTFYTVDGGVTWDASVYASAVA